MLKFGIISEVDAGKGLARVQFPDCEGMVTKFLPISYPKTLKDKFSIPFDVNEHVWCLMDDELENGVIGGAIYSKNETPGFDKVGIHFEQGLNIEYDRATRILSITGQKQLKINVSEDIQLQSATKVKITAPIIEIIGNVTVTGTVSAAGFSGVAGTGGPGDMTVAGKITADGDIKSNSGDVKAGNITLSLHKHTGVQTGSGTSGPATP